MDKSTIRIVVLDDEPLMLNLLMQVLRGLGFSQLTQCDNGHSALQVVDGTAPPDLILLDLNMPDMDGVEFVRRLVDHHYRGSLVLVSGEDPRVLQMAENLIRAHRITVVGHLKKPFTRREMEEIMQRALQTRRDTPAPRKVYDPESVRAAIEHGQLVNFYQPLVEVATASLVGVETLVRWVHPEDGLVFPDQFIGVAEQHGLIDPLTRVVLRSALAQSRRWRDTGLSLSVSINVSMDNLSSTDFVDYVSQEAMRVEIAPPDIVLEVTESRLMLDQRAPLEVLARLRMKRFRLAIDDFGTGHSSLRQLRDIPFDELKIDRSFVHGASLDATAKAIYDASLALGKQLGMTVVAEGVETRQDWDLLQRTRCDLAQGYFIGRPMRADDLTGWVEEWNLRRNSMLASDRGRSATEGDALRAE